MTSLPIVPSKFYQVCRLCLTVVSDTNDLLNLSVFGSHNAACIANATVTNSTTADDCNSPAVNASSNNNSTNTGSGSSSSSNVGVIVKTNRKYSTPTSEHKNTAASNNASDNEAAAAADASGRDSGNDGKTAAAESSRGNNPGDDDNNNFKIDGDLHQSDILERIHTFLSITVSGRTFYPPFAQFFVFIFLHISSATTEHVYKFGYLYWRQLCFNVSTRFSYFHCYYSDWSNVSER